MPQPEDVTPIVSAVLVCRGAAELTRRSLAALSANTEVPWEAIVVDDGSDAENREALSRLAAPTLILDSSTRGFGPSSNQGAQAARGRYLLLLNTDAFVHPGWFAPLAAALEDGLTAAVVPKLLNEDGTLQETGVLLAQDGGVLFHGGGADADDRRYCFRRQVDAGSGAVMLLDREEFLGLGGFDVAYAPAYYEDTDLCMRISASGRRVLCEPASVATHIRYGSSDPDSARTLSQANRRRFVERWAGALAGRPVSFDGVSEQAALTARDANAHPRVLLCPGSTGDSHAEAGRLADRVLTFWPAARVTCAGVDRDAPETFSPWVEWIEDAEPNWLQQRLFHYDVVIPAADADVTLLSAISATQPQAEWFAPSTLESDAGMLAAFARAGVTGPGGVSSSG